MVAAVTPASTVSVVIAVYNEEHHLARLLASLERQSLRPAEVIVVDDGSTDRTAEIASLRPEVQVKRLAHRGPARARNAGAADASGDILVFLDGDMACAPDFLERLVAPILAGQAVGTFTSDIRLGNPHNRWARAFADVRNCPAGGDRLLAKDFPDRWDNFRAIRRDRFLAAGGYDDVGYGEDMTLAPKVGETAVAAPGAACFHYQPESLPDIFLSGRWVGRGAAIRALPRPWWTHSPPRVAAVAVGQIRAGRAGWVLPARVVYHLGVWVGMASAALSSQRHWK